MKTKRVLRVLLALVFVLTLLPGVTAPAKAAGDVAINETNFPDANFRKWVSDHCDGNQDGKLSASETLVTYMDVSGRQIKSLEGIRFFSVLEQLNCSENELTALELEGCYSLQKLYCADNRLTTLSVSPKLSLVYLDCSGNRFTELNLSDYSNLTELRAGRNPSLHMLICERCGLTGLDVSGNTAMEYLYCANNQLAALDLSQDPALVLLDCCGNQLTALDFCRNPEIYELHLDENRFTGLNLNGLSKLAFLNADNSQDLNWLTCASCGLLGLSVENCTALETLDCHNNALLEVDVKDCTALTTLYCYDNQLQILNVSYCPELQRLYCQNNLLEDMYVSKNGKLQTLSCYNNHLLFLDIYACPYLKQAFSGKRSSFNGLDGLCYSYSDSDCCLEMDASVIVQDKLEPVIVTVEALGNDYYTGDTIKWCAYADGGSRPLKICFHLYKDGAVIQKGSYDDTYAARFFSYTPTEPGSYAVKVFVKDAAGKSVSKMSEAVPVKAGALTITGITVKEAEVKLNETLTWTAAASGGVGGLLYNFYLYRDGTLLQKTGYTPLNILSYTGDRAGTYSVKVYVKDNAGTVVSQSGGSATVASPPLPLSIFIFKPDKTDAKPGDTVTWTVSAIGGQGTLRYNFYVYRDGAVVLKTGYTASAAVSYTASAAGSYSAKVFVKDGKGTVVSKLSDSVTVAAPASPLTVTGVAANKTTAKPGDSVTWTAAASGGSGTLRYNFYIYKDGSILQKTGYTAAKTAAYPVAEAGTYSVKVFVKDSAGTVVTRTGGTVTVAAATGALAIGSITPNKTSAKTGETVTWTASATGGSGTLRYCFYIYKDGTVVLNTGYGTAKSVSYTPAEAGSYSAKVFVKDASGNAAAKVSGSVTVSGSAAGALAIGSITPSKTSAKTGDTVTWTAVASGGSGSLRYCFYIYKDGTAIQKGSYGAANTVTYTVSAAGNYTVKVFAKDSAGAAVSKTGGACLVS